MKKILSFLLCVLMIFSFCACGKKAAEAPKEPSEFLPKTFYYYNNNLSLGMVTLNPDKIFSGEYKEYRADATGDNYKNGTMYVSTFTGRFEEIKKMNDYSYLLTLDDVGTGQKKGTERIENDLRYYSIEAVGFTDSGVFMLYTPDTPIENLPKEFLKQWPKKDNKKLKTLSCYAIMNMATKKGYFSD